MQIILLERVERLGNIGDEVTVRPGFARNFLLPQKKALRATAENRAYFKDQRQSLEAANLRRRDEAEEIAKRMSGLSLTVIRQASENGQLYGSVSARDVAAALDEAGFRVETRQIQLHQPIKATGIHEIGVALHPDVSVAIAVNVAKSADEAENQAVEAANAAEIEAIFEDGAAPEALTHAPLDDAESETGADTDDETGDRDTPAA